MSTFDEDDVDEGPELCNCDVCECVNREYMAGAGLCGCCAADCPDVHPETGGSLLAGRVLTEELLIGLREAAEGKTVSSDWLFEDEEDSPTLNE